MNDISHILEITWTGSYLSQQSHDVQVSLRFSREYPGYQVYRAGGCVVRDSQHVFNDSSVGSLQALHVTLVYSQRVSPIQETWLEVADEHFSIRNGAYAF